MKNLPTTLNFLMLAACGDSGGLRKPDSDRSHLERAGDAVGGFLNWKFELQLTPGSGRIVWPQ